MASTNHDDALSSFSNWGEVAVDLAAPGSNIYSTLPFGRYGPNSGTSMAAPHVTGVIALMRAQSPVAPYPTILQRLYDSVEPVPTLAGITVTGGRLDALLAVADPDSIAPAPVVDLRVVGTGSNHLDLAWTAPGDDGNEGRASLYDLRMSTQPITAERLRQRHHGESAPAPRPREKPKAYASRTCPSTRCTTSRWWRSTISRTARAFRTSPRPVPNPLRARRSYRRC